MNRVLAIDYGDVRVGLALSDLTCTIAKPFKTLNYNNMDDLLNQLFEISEENNVNKIVVGIPYNMKGNDWKNTQVYSVLKRYEEKMFRQQIAITKYKSVWSKMWLEYSSKF